jgi:hypothetical protein
LAEVADDEPCKFYYLNIFNLPADIEDKEIFLFYKEVPLTNIHRPSRDAADLEFEKKEHLIAAIDRGTGTFRGQSFYMRTSYFLSRNQRNMGKSSRGGRGGRYGGGGR